MKKVADNVTEQQVTILEATGHDLDDIADMAREIWPICFKSIISPDQIDYMLEMMYSPKTLANDLKEGVVYWRAVVDNGIVGYAALGPCEKMDKMKLHKLYVHPAWHGRGYGSLLLAQVEQYARSRGCRTLVLSVNRKNAAAITVYRKHGFEIVGELASEIGGGFVMDDFLMAKTVG